MQTQSLGRLGFWSALMAAVFSTMFSVSAVLGFTKVLPYPWDPIIPHGASLILAYAFVVMMVCIHSSAAAEKRHWTLAGVAFATLYAGLVSIVYFVSVTVVVPLTLRGAADKMSPFLFDQSGSFMQALDGLGYFLMSVATWFAGPAFAADGPEKWMRRTFIINGVLGIPILFAYMPLIFSQPFQLVFLLFGVLWMFSVPAAAALAAAYFRKSTR